MWLQRWYGANECLTAHISVRADKWRKTAFFYRALLTRSLTVIPQLSTGEGVGLGHIACASRYLEALSLCLRKRRMQVSLCSVGFCCCTSESLARPLVWHR
jgi:hypothetical protein